MSADSRSPPSWKLPQGVNASLWRYAHEPRLADDEDEYFRDHPLFREDAKALAERFVDPAPLIDLGCGAGRLSLEFASRGFPVVAVDLSRSMLGRVATKAAEAGRKVATVQANLCDLGGFPGDFFGYALMMFSTLGMVRGRGARRKALSQAARVLRPGGRLALHAHNLWLNLGDSQGRRWLVSQLLAAARGGDHLGDRRMTYRGVPAMEVHLYRWAELRDDLRSAGFRIDEAIPLDAVTARIIPAPRFLPTWRAGGWIVFASKARPGDEETRRRSNSNFCSRGRK